jgi:hypothetical protein
MTETDTGWMGDMMPCRALSAVRHAVMIAVFSAHSQDSSYLWRKVHWFTDSYK